MHIYIYKVKAKNDGTTAEPNTRLLVQGLDGLYLIKEGTDIANGALRQLFQGCCNSSEGKAGQTPPKIVIWQPSFSQQPLSKTPMQQRDRVEDRESFDKS